MKLVIIGAVAAGTSAAAEARRGLKDAEIKVFEADSDISYVGCGLPYYIGNRVTKRSTLVPRDAAFFKEKHNIEIFTRHLVTELDPDKKQITVENLETGESFSESYDKLVLATGASSFVPPLPGIDKENVFALRSAGDADKIRDFILSRRPRNAVIVGTGFIGLEVAENLLMRGIHTTLVELAPQVMPALDSDMADLVREHIEAQGVDVITGDSVASLEGGRFATKAVLKGGTELAADMIIMAVGVRPNVSLARQAGLNLGATGAIAVNKAMETSVADIYACGDCAESYSVVTGKPFYRPLGSTANKMGRVVGIQVSGGSLEFQGGLGTGIFKLFDLAVAQTGLTAKEALKEGFDIVTVKDTRSDKPGYFHGEEMTIKTVADRKTGRLLGAQIIGKAGVDKRIDVVGTAITYGAQASDLMHLDLAYAPPYSTARDPLMYSGILLDKALKK